MIDDEMIDDELVLLSDDLPSSGASPAGSPPPWKLLVVDDDDEVHTVTRFVLGNLRILGRPLQLYHAYDSRQGRSELCSHPDVALALLDVVMETERAGLDLVSYIRDELHLSECRIMLRTGQPGYAPELAVIQQYDINDYRTKAELTNTRLITTVSAALRSYQQLHALAEHRRGLELIVGAAADLMEQHAITNLAEGILTQLAALLKLPVDGIVCSQRGAPFGGDGEKCYVVGAAGRHAAYIARPLDELPDRRVVRSIQVCVAKRQHVFAPDHTVLYLKAAPNQEAAIFVDSGNAVAAMDRPLLEVFVANIAACFRNVKLVERLHDLAFEDQVTRLANRLQYIADLESAARARRDVIAALIDIDHFADLNDGLGPDVGDLLLIAFATRLREHLGDGCRLARIGADVFGVLGPASVVNADHLGALCYEPFEVGEYQLPITVSIGLCRHFEESATGLTLLKRVNIALNRAKRSFSSHYEDYRPELEENTRWRVEVLRQLRQDFQAGKLEVWYQPQVALASHTVTGLEALVRWPNGKGGFTQTPDVFIPLAEYSGLIVQIGVWVLEQACAEHVRLAQNGFTGLTMAVNVSIGQFRKAGFVDDVARALKNSGMPAELLELEITESIAMDEPRIVRQSLDALKQMGVHIAIDDFGTGFSSLGQLQNLPIDRLKIDRTFIQEIAQEKRGLYAETIVGLAGDLKVQSVAEGVETPEQAAVLRRLGCTTVQGWLYGRALPRAELDRWLRSPPLEVTVGHQPLA